MGSNFNLSSRTVGCASGRSERGVGADVFLKRVGAVPNDELSES